MELVATLAVLKGAARAICAGAVERVGLQAQRFYAGAFSETDLTSGGSAIKEAERSLRFSSTRPRMSASRRPPIRHAATPTPSSERGAGRLRRRPQVQRAAADHVLTPHRKL